MRYAVAHIKLHNFYGISYTEKELKLIIVEAMNPATALVRGVQKLTDVSGVAFSGMTTEEIQKKLLDNKQLTAVTPIT
jgi:hypothetical protein